MQQKKVEKITIALPPDILVTIKEKVGSGFYGSTSELIREAVRPWQKIEEEHQARLSAIREHLEHSTQNGHPIPLNKAFESIEDLHKNRIKKNYL